MSSPFLHVVGARPNFMKAGPVIEALSRRRCDQFVVHTGQHYDPQLSQVFFDELALPEPDRYLGIGSGTHAEQTARLTIAIEKVVEETSPLCVIVYGDVNSTLASSLVAAKAGCALAHVEAGLRSFDRTMPEEINRVVTDSLADLLFATSPEALVHLGNEGVDARNVHFVGNPMIDTLDRIRPRLEPSVVRRRMGLGDHIGVVTLHRPANVDDPQRASRILEGLRRIAADVELVFPIHPRGRRRLASLGIERIDGLLVTEPLGYIDFVSLLCEAAFVVTDSGGVQEETTVLGVPCLTVRDNTERPITISAGTNRLVEANPTALEVAAKQTQSQNSQPSRPPLWDGQAGERIAAVLSERFAADRAAQGPSLGG